MTLRICQWDERPIACLAAVTAAALCLCAGCSSRNITADNPVVSLVPPRVDVAQQAHTGQPTASVETRTESGVEQVSFADTSDVEQPDAVMSQVAAVVDGTPILVSDVLEPYAMKLAQAEQQLPRDEFEQLRKQLIRRELPQMIDQVVLRNAALSQLDEAGKQQLEQKLDEFFTQNLQQIQERTGAGTLAELEAQMQAQGTTLSNLRRAFGRQQLAQQGLMLHKPGEPTVNRTELLAEYEKRIEEYMHPAEVKWQQIRISFNRHGGKKKALEVLDRAIAELRKGTDFSAVAKEYSDGVMAKNGGHWDWTQKGSLTNPELEQLLFGLNVGEIGKVIVDEDAFQIVRVTERKPDRVTPFEEVQSELRGEIKERKNKELTDQVIQRLKKDAVVTTMFDAS